VGAQLIIQEKVEAVVTTLIGATAFDALSLYGVKIYCGSCQFTGNSGEAALAYRDGKLLEITAPNITGAGYSRGLTALPALPLTQLTPTLTGTGGIVPGGGQTSYTLTQGGPPTLTQGSASQITTCACPVCGYMEQHQIGVPCYATTCPKCGSIMVRSDRLISLTGGTTSGGKPVSYAPIAGMPTSGKPEDIPPVSYVPVQLTAGKPVSYAPVTYAPVGGTTSGGKPVSYAPIAGMPTSGKPEDIPPVSYVPVGGTTSGGKPVSYAPVSDNTTLGVCVDLCVCPQCGFSVEHPDGVPCNTLRCPVCGSALMSATKVISLTSGKPENIPPVSYTLVSKNPGNEEEVVDEEESDGFKGKPLQVPLMGKREDVEANIINIYQVAGQPQQTNAPVTIASPQSLYLGLALPGDKGGAANTGRASFVPVQGITQIAGAPADNPGTVWLNTCYCPMCGITVPRPLGTPCAAMTCPNCGGKLVNTTAGNTGSGNSPANRVIPSVTQLPATVQILPQATNTLTGTSTLAQIPAAARSGQSVINVSLPVPKVAVAVDKKKITSDIAPLFDNAKYFLILGYGGYEFISNPNAKDKTGAGIQTAQFLVGEGVSVVIANNISLDALKALKELKVTVYSGLTGSAQQAVAWYQEGRLEATVLKDDEGNHDTTEGKQGKGPREDKAKGEATKAVF